MFRFLFVISILFWANFASAQILISEIMYNPEGSDTGKEWIEIYNNGSELADLTGWKLFEADTNHKIISAEEGGSLEIPANSYAIIVDNADKFKENYSSFSGLVFDSVYSLSNTGENLILRDGELNDIDSLNYVSDWGANGDGNSLQLVNEKWIAGILTLGLINNSNEQQIDSINTVDSGSINNTVDFFEPKIFASAGENKKVVVGADSEFKASAVGLENEPMENARYSWTFGDGGLKEGKNVLYNYKYPGKYIVVLNVSSGEFSASDRISVEVLPANINISFVDNKNNFIELFNQSDHELNLSLWRICSGNQFFTLPRDTIILPNNKLKLSSFLTNLKLNDLSQIYLLYPNGEIVNQYNIVSARSGTEWSDVAVQETTKTQSTETQKLSNKTQIEQITKTQTENFAKQNSFNKDETLGENQNQLALVGNKTNSKLFNKWTFSLLGLILISTIGVFISTYSNKENEENFEDELSPDDFKIIE